MKDKIQNYLKEINETSIDKFDNKIEGIGDFHQNLKISHRQYNHYGKAHTETNQLVQSPRAPIAVGGRI